MLEDKIKERDGLYKCRLRQNKTRDMMNRIGIVYAQRQNERTHGSYGCCLRQTKQET